VHRRQVQALLPQMIGVIVKALEMRRFEDAKKVRNDAVMTRMVVMASFSDRACGTLS